MCLSDYQHVVVNLDLLPPFSVRLSRGPSSCACTGPTGFHFWGQESGECRGSGEMTNLKSVIAVLVCSHVMFLIFNV